MLEKGELFKLPREPLEREERQCLEKRRPLVDYLRR